MFAQRRVYKLCSIIEYCDNIFYLIEQVIMINSYYY